MQPASSSKRKWGWGAPKSTLAACLPGLRQSGRCSSKMNTHALFPEGFLPLPLVAPGHFPGWVVEAEFLWTLVHSVDTGVFRGFCGLLRTWCAPVFPDELTFLV